MAPGEKAKVHDVDAEAVVDYYDPYWKLLWVQADGAVAYIPLGSKPLPIRSGQRIRINGQEVPEQGLSGDQITVTVLAENENISSSPIGDNVTNWDSWSAKKVSLRAYVNSASETDPHHLHLQLSVPGQVITAYVLLNDSDVYPNFEQAFVDLEGTLIVTPDPAGKVAQLVMWMPALKDVSNVAPLASDRRFRQPPVAIERLPEAPADQLIHLAGVVQGLEPGRSVTIRDEGGQVVLLTTEQLAVKPGDAVDAIGYPLVEGASWKLQRAWYRPAGPAASADATAGAQLPRLRLADQVLSLSPEEAARRRPVSVAGVVTWADPNADFFFLADSSGSVRVETGGRFHAPEIGTSLRVSGATETGPFAPVVAGAKVEIAGTTGQPEVAGVSFEEAVSGVLENRLVRMEGYVRAVTHSESWARLEILTSRGEFTALTRWDPAALQLQRTVVRLDGVCTAVADRQRQLTAVTLWVPSLASIVVQEATPADPFQIPMRPIASLRRFSTARQSNRLVHVAGTVTRAAAGQSLSIQDGATALRVFLAAPAPLALGDRVEIVGFPGRDDASVILREAVERKLGSGPEPPPVVVRSPRDVGPELDGRLVTVAGRLLESFQHDRGLRLSLGQDGLVFECRLDDLPASGVVPRAGAELSVTGIYEVQLDKDRKPQRFLLQLRGLSDVAVVQDAGWWSVERALLTVAAIGVALVLGLLWVAVLRRRVRHQTEQLRAQWETEVQLKSRQTEIVENASDFIYTTDAQGRFTSFNAAGERLTGFQREEALGMRLSDLIVEPGADSSAFQPTNADARLGRLVTKDQRFLWVETSARPVFQGTEQVGELGIVRDIGKRKQTEEELTRARDVAEAAAKSKSAFLANMSHEIRTPMNGVIGMTNLLLDTKLNQEQESFAETIRNSAEALLTVLNDILDFSKIEAGKLQFETIDFDLRDVVEGAMELLAPRASSKDLEITVLIAPDLPCHLQGDPGRLRQILLNLTGNAIKFTERGEIAVTVDLVAAKPESVEVRIAIRDTGIGLGAEAVGRLFRAFSQADESTSRRFGGTGLGLAISKQIVEMMHGQIGVESAVGRGSTFWFTARLDRQARADSSPPQDLMNQLRGRRALVVDDNETNRRIVRHYVSAFGMATEEANDGPTALALLRAPRDPALKFDVVLSDFQMPGMDGIDFCRTVHDDPNLGGLPLLLLSSLDRRVSGTILGACGVLELLTKPLRQRELVAAILRAVAPDLSAPADGPATPSLPDAGPAAGGGVPASTDHAAVLHILVAEDNAVNQRVTMFQVKKLGHKAEVAADGLEVLEALERSVYDVILMDCQMPEMDGYEATRRIRQNPRHRDICIIAMTANAMKGDREVCLAAGMDDYIAKPTAPSDLKRALTRVRARPRPTTDATLGVVG